MRKNCRCLLSPLDRRGSGIEGTARRRRRRWWCDNGDLSTGWKEGGFAIGGFLWRRRHQDILDPAWMSLLVSPLEGEGLGDGGAGSASTKGEDEKTSD